MLSPILELNLRRKKGVTMTLWAHEFEFRPGNDLSVSIQEIVAERTNEYK